MARSTAAICCSAVRQNQGRFLCDTHLSSFPNTGCRQGASSPSIYAGTARCPSGIFAGSTKILRRGLRPPARTCMRVARAIDCRKDRRPRATDTPREGRARTAARSARTIVLPADRNSRVMTRRYSRPSSSCRRRREISRRRSAPSTRRARLAPRATDHHLITPPRREPRDSRPAPR